MCLLTFSKLDLKEWKKSMVFIISESLLCILTHSLAFHHLNCWPFRNLLPPDCLPASTESHLQKSSTLEPFMPIVKVLVLLTTCPFPPQALRSASVWLGLADLPLHLLSYLFQQNRTLCLSGSVDGRAHGADLLPLVFQKIYFLIAFPWTQVGQLFSPTFCNLSHLHFWWILLNWLFWWEGCG